MNSKCRYQVSVPNPLQSLTIHDSDPLDSVFTRVLSGLSRQETAVCGVGREERGRLERQSVTEQIFDEPGTAATVLRYIYKLSLHFSHAWMVSDTNKPALDRFADGESVEDRAKIRHAWSDLSRMDYPPSSKSLFIKKCDQSIAMRYYECQEVSSHVLHNLRS